MLPCPSTLGQEVAQHLNSCSGYFGIFAHDLHDLNHACCEGVSTLFGGGDTTLTLTDIRLGSHKQRIPCHHICATWLTCRFLEDIANAQGF